MWSIICWSVVDNSYEKIYDMMPDLEKLRTSSGGRSDASGHHEDSLENFIYTKEHSNILGQLCSWSWRI